MSDHPPHDDCDGQYHMVMPLVACASQGGPYDDNAYVSGWEMGALYQLLTTSRVTGMATTIHDGNVRQADLIAMHVNMTMTVHEERDGWAAVSFARAEDDLS